MKKLILLLLLTANAHAIDPISAVVVGSSVVGAGASIYTASKANDTNKKVNSIAAQNNKNSSVTAIKCFVTANYRCWETSGDTKCCLNDHCGDSITDRVLLVAQDKASIKYPVIIEVTEGLKYHKCILI